MVKKILFSFNLAPVPLHFRESIFLLFSIWMAFYFMCLSSKMRKCRSRVRWLQPRHHVLLKVALCSLAFSLLVLAYLYYSELTTKMKLIDLALGSRSVEDMVKPNNNTLILNGLLRKVCPFESVKKLFNQI